MSQQPARPRLQRGEHAAAPALRVCGPTLTAFARELLASRPAARRFGDGLFELLVAGQHVALRVCDLGSGEAAARRLDALCRRLAQRLRGLNPSRLELTVDAAAVPPLCSWEIRCAAFRAGVLNVVLGEQAAAGDGLWGELWQLRNLPVRVAAWPSAGSATSLLAAEAAADVVPTVGLQAPSQSAFIVATLDLGTHCSPRGRISTASVERQLTALIDAADALHDDTTWPTPSMQHDAWWNRRIAIEVRGIGDVVKRARRDPRAQETLVELDLLIAHLRSTAISRSRALAQSRETLPAIDANDPGSRVAGSVLQAAWQRRWRCALERDGLAHRNLIAVSPWSLFPRDDARYRYVCLAPLLARADVCGCRRRISLRGWSAARLRAFYDRVTAARRACDAQMVVAEQP